MGVYGRLRFSMDREASARRLDPFPPPDNPETASATRSVHATAVVAHHQRHRIVPAGLMHLVLGKADESEFRHAVERVDAGLGQFSPGYIAVPARASQSNRRKLVLFEWFPANRVGYASAAC